MTKHTLKILWCLHRKIFKVFQPFYNIVHKKINISVALFVRYAFFVMLLVFLKKKKKLNSSKNKLSSNIIFSTIVYNCNFVNIHTILEKLWRIFFRKVILSVMFVSLDSLNFFVPFCIICHYSFLFLLILQMNDPR